LTGALVTRLSRPPIKVGDKAKFDLLTILAQLDAIKSCTCDDLDAITSDD
jgi:hypothetical protein